VKNRLGKFRHHFSQHAVTQIFFKEQSRGFFQSAVVRIFSKSSRADFFKEQSRGFFQRAVARIFSKRSRAAQYFIFFLTAFFYLIFARAAQKNLFPRKNGFFIDHAGAKR